MELQRPHPLQYQQLHQAPLQLQLLLQAIKNCPLPLQQVQQEVLSSPIINTQPMADLLLLLYRQQVQQVQLPLQV